MCFPSRTRPSLTKTALCTAAGPPTPATSSRWALAGWLGNDLREHAKRVRCPTLVIHGDKDGRVPYASGQADRRAGARRAPADRSAAAAI